VKDLSLREILRYGVAGGVLLLTIAAIEGSSILSRMRIDSLGGATAFLAVALVLGAVLYSVHRALLFPFALRAQLKYSAAARDLLGLAVPIWTIVSDGEMKFDQLRWSEPVALGKNYSEWGDQMHLLYTSGEAIAVGLFVELVGRNRLALWAPNSAPDVVANSLLVCAAVLLAAGAISQRRLLTVTCKMLSRKRAGEPSGQAAA